jgi:hypothetical protein
MLHYRHRAELLLKPYQADLYNGLRVTDHSTSGDVWYGQGALAGVLNKGAAIRLFQQPCPIPYTLVMHFKIY